MLDASLIFSILSLVCSFVAILFTWANSRRIKQESDAGLLQQLQADYEVIRARMDTRYRDETWIPDRSDKAIWCPLEEYWFFCYREWRTTRGRYAKLWKDDIRKGVKAGLRHRPLRYVLATIRKEGSLTDEYAMDFIEELIAIHGSDFQTEIYPPATVSEPV